MSDAEYHVLLAAMALAFDWGLDNHAWQISLVMLPINAVQSHHCEWTAIKRTHMAAGVRDDAAMIASGARDTAGTLGAYQWVPEYCASMARLHQQLGNRRGQALCLYSKAALAEYQGQHAEALGHAEQAASLFRSIGDKAAETELLNTVGWYHAPACRADHPNVGAWCPNLVSLVGEWRLIMVIVDRVPSCRGLMTGSGAPVDLRVSVCRSR